MKNKIIIGTRKSKLAMRQTELVTEMLRNKFPDLQVEVKEIVTEGDRNQKDSLIAIGGKGVFVKEIEKDLLNREIDIAVHSLKDVMPVLPDELKLGAFPKRNSPFDCLISREHYESIQDLPRNARVGTNSSRRMGQLLAVRPDIEIVPIRGNVDTRIKKIESENLVGVVLAEAGIRRLNLDLSEYQVLNLADVIVPAVGQGVMAIECRKDDQAVCDILDQLNDAETETCVEIERSFMRELGGNCNFPIGGFARPVNGKLRFTGLIASPDGQHVVRQDAVPVEDTKTGIKVADQLLAADKFGIIEGK